MRNYIRKCPRCNKEISYKHEDSCLNAENKKTLCRACVNQTKNNSCLIAWERKYGKDGSKTRMQEMVEKMKTTRENNPEARILESQRKSQASKGSNNPMHGKSLYDVWLSKLNKEEADKKQKELNKKRSKNSTGENNPMYGKPAPQGSGNGWQGWYKGTYFASLREFYYLKFLFDNDIKFENGEKNKFKVQYEFQDKKLNYFLDFYLPETDEYIEIKPKKLINSPKNLAKFKAAKEKYGNRFKVLTEDDICKVSLDTMYELYKNRDLVFMERYEKIFLDFYKNNKESE